MPGLAELDDEESSPVEPNDVFQTTILAATRTDDSPFRPMLAVACSMYSESFHRIAPALPGPNPDTKEGLYCPLCVDRLSYDIHVAHECTDTECQVTEEDFAGEPWDELNIKYLATGLMAFAREKGALPPLQ